MLLRHYPTFSEHWFPNLRFQNSHWHHGAVTFSAALLSLLISWVLRTRKKLHGFTSFPVLS
jgi:hypothetical protein